MAMEKELLELFEAAKKAADDAANDAVSSSGPEVARCVDALKQLKSFPVTYDMLVSTQVGKRLRSLTKHPRDKIQSVASGLLDMWKKIVIDETAKKKNGTIDGKTSVKQEVDRAEPVKVEKVQKASTVRVEKHENDTIVGKTSVKQEAFRAVKVEKVQKASPIKVERCEETVKVEKMDCEGTVKVEKISKEEKQTSNVKKPLQAPNATPKLTTLVKCNDALRDKIRELLAEAFSKVASEVDDDIKNEVDACDPIRVAVSVESAMFEKLGRSNGAQKLKYRSIMFNLKDANNPDLRRKVLLGEISAEKLLTLTPEEMASEQRQIENRKIKEKALFDCERGGPPKATTDQFKCGRCGQRKCTYYQMQTRSADEPMTTYVTCVNCNNHWKFC